MTVVIPQRTSSFWKRQPAESCPRAVFEACENTCCHRMWPTWVRDWDESNLVVGLIIVVGLARVHFYLPSKQDGDVSHT